jgi:hypothetical protein
MKKAFILFLIIICIKNSSTQEVYHHISNTNIYSFLDELVNEHLIILNSSVKPYSRTFIAETLQELEEKKDQLSFRQKSELEFYLKDFNKDSQVKTLTNAWIFIIIRIRCLLSQLIRSEGSNTGQIRTGRYITAGTERKHLPILANTGDFMPV